MMDIWYLDEVLFHEILPNLEEKSSNLIAGKTSTASKCKLDKSGFQMIHKCPVSKQYGFCPKTGQNVRIWMLKRPNTGHKKVHYYSGESGFRVLGSLLYLCDNIFEFTGDSIFIIVLNSRYRRGLALADT